MDTPIPVNHVFVDFENVHAVDPAIIGAKSVSLVLLIGAKQAKLDVELVEHMLRHSASVELIRLKSSGKNALDFALAYYLGRITATHPNDYFHIVSKDQGFKPLIEHLRAKNIRIRLHPDFTALTFAATPPPLKPASITPAPAAVTLSVPAAPASTASPLPAAITARAATKPPPAPFGELAQRLFDHLGKNTANRPRLKKTLLVYARSYLGNKVDPGDAAAGVEELFSAGHVTINPKGALTYQSGLAKASS